MQQQKLQLINIYTPPDRAGKMRIFYKLQGILNVGYRTTVCGDFNTITDDKDRIPHKNIPITKDSKLLKKICN